MKYRYVGIHRQVTLDAFGVTVANGDVIDVPAEHRDEFDARSDWKRVDTKKAASAAATKAEEATK